MKKNSCFRTRDVDVFIYRAKNLNREVNRFIGSMLKNQKKEKVKKE